MKIASVAEIKAKFSGYIEASKAGPVVVTKNGKPMGFATIEDIQGNIELVLFPRTWEKAQGQLTLGQIVIVEGKVDTSNTPPKVLVDTIRTEIKITDTAEELLREASPLARPAHGTAFAERPPAPSVTAVPARVVSLPVGKPVAVPVPYTAVPAPVVKIAERRVQDADDWDIADMPPPPDNFPAGWETEWQPSFENAELAARPEPKPDDRPVAWRPAPDQLRSVVPEPPVASPPAESTREPAPRNVVQPKPAVQRLEPMNPVPPPLPSLYVPLAQADKDADHPPRQITVMLRSMGDRDRDKLRIKTLYGTLISFHGHDRFSFQIYEAGKGHLIDFPNDTTRICAEMLARLEKLLGAESWRIEEIQ